MGVTSPSGSLVADLFDHLGAELALEQLGGAHPLVLGVEVVGVGVGVGRRPVRAALHLGGVGRAGLLDRLPGGGAGVRPRRLGGRGRGLRLGLGHRGLRHGRGALGASAGVDDGLDLPVRADHVDRRLAQHLVAAAADERVARAGVGEAEGERGGVHADHLAVLGQVHPGQPAAHLRGLDDVRPQPAHVDEAERTARGGLRRGRRGCRGGSGGGLGLGLWLGLGLGLDGGRRGRRGRLDHRDRLRLGLRRGRQGRRRGRAVLVGDAAHAQPPNLGQGANLTFQNV
ncbi:FAD-dependent monooxygenase, partial [Nocardioides aquiterrae]|uniref:FAD-dependent monooxygenase n=1 Tax=Nocardioides aquiterrae TaxID=203799 RepID=UPI003CD05949